MTNFKPINQKEKKIKIWDIQNLGETLEDIMEGQLLIIKYIKSLSSNTYDQENR